MSTRVASPDFVGRRAELAELEAALGRAAAGEPAVVFVGGESGIGKSRLVAEVIGRALERGTRVLTGDCVDLGDAELPYAPIVAALRDIGREEVEAVVGPAAAELAPLLPQLDAAAAGAPAQGRLFELLLALIGGLGDEGRPVLLVIEDLHWADRSTRDFVAFLLRNARRQRVAVVATYRTDELHRRHPLRAFLAEAERAPAVTRVALQRLSREEMRTQLEGILGRRPDPRLVDELFVRAEGNPFYTEELVAASAGRAGARLPENVRDTLMVRIEALSPDAQAVLRVAAAAGARVRHALLERASGLAPDTLLAGLREAVVHHVLVQDPATDAYAFRHALLREALLDDLLPGERGPLHGALARALAYDPSLSVSQRGVAAELASHWAAAHDLPAAFSAYCDAGAEAERVAAFAEANAHFERAAELWDAVPADRRADGPSRVELLQRAAEAALLAGDGDRAAALARPALALVDAEADPMTAARLYERLGRYQWMAGLSDDALASLQRAVELLPQDGPGPERARILAADGHLLMLCGRLSAAVARCEAALVVARAAGARREEGSILNSLGGALAQRGETAGAIEHLREAQRIAVSEHDLDQMMRAYVNLGQALDVAGHVEEAAAVAREGLEVATRERIVTARGMLAGDLSWRLLRLGRWEEATRAVDEALESALTGLPRNSALTSRGHLEALTGELERAQRTLDEAEALQRQAVGAVWSAPLALARVEAALWDGRPEAARPVVDAELNAYDVAEADVFSITPLLGAALRAEADLAVRARASADAGAEAEALRRTAALRDTLAGLQSAPSIPPEARLDVAWAEAEAERAHGRATAATWRALAERWEAFATPYPAAYARWREGEAALAAGAPREAVAAALGAARAMAVELGARPLQAEVDDIARRARLSLAAAPAPAAADAGVAERLGLTSRELDVLRRLAAGDSNREIGQALYISHKTVSVHVSRILAKLDARTRVEAAGLAQRLGLLDEGGGGADQLGAGTMRM